MKNKYAFPSSVALAALDEKGLRVIVLMIRTERWEKDFFNNFIPLNRQMKLLKILPWTQPIKDIMIHIETELSDARKVRDIL